MPKVNYPSVPLNGLFGINKPSGLITMHLLDRLKLLITDSPVFMNLDPLDRQRRARAKTGALHKLSKKSGGGPKLGQGGTLDPLASGVLVIGVGKGTKRLGEFLHCTKEYKTTGLFGCETDSYDSQGALVRHAPWEHITREKVEEVLSLFRGPIKQYPPIYSAIKMEGKPLYEYAREGKDLPRPIEARDANIISIELVDWQEAAESEYSAGHQYSSPTKVLPENHLAALKKVKNLILEAEARHSSSSITDSPPEAQSISLKALEQAQSYQTSNSNTMLAKEGQSSSGSSQPHKKPPTFTLKMTVSSGTYVRSIVHDIGLALGSAAHVVALERTRQGNFSLEDTEGEDRCIDWSIFQAALDEQQAGQKGSPITAAFNPSQRAYWEKEVYTRIHCVEPE